MCQVETKIVFFLWETSRLVSVFLSDCDTSFYWNNSWHGNKVYYYYEYKFKIATIMHHDCIIKPWIETHDYNVVIVTRRGV